MAKSSDFLRIIPELKKKSPKWTSYVFFGSLVPLVLLGGLYLFLQVKISSLKTEKVNIEASIMALDANTLNRDAQKQVSDIQKRLGDFSVILKEHKYASNFFDFVRSFCHKKVQYSEFSLNAKTAQATLAGSADNFQALGEQLLMLNENSDILSAESSGINLQKEGKVSFNLSLKFTEGILLQDKNE